MKYSFDIEKTPPFLAFRALREIASKSIGEANVLDLSQGEPGYGFSPSRRGRRFMSFITMLDADFNDHQMIKKLFAYRKREELSEIEAKIEQVAMDNFSPVVAKELLSDFYEFMGKLEGILRNQKLSLSRFDVYYELFKYSTLSGGRYPQPTGHLLLQAVSAEEYSEYLGVKVWHDELITISGASHGIGAVFKALGREGVGFLKEDDTVCMTSPVYAPYNVIFNQRGIHVKSLYVDPESGKIDLKRVAELKKSKDRIKCIILIDPNNPTGFAANDEFLSAVAEIAETHNSLIVTDEVYFRFFEGKKSIVSIPSAAKRTVRIDSLSKIERSTGLRVGDIYVSKEANEFISENILGHHIGDYPDFHNLLILAKSPGGRNIGLFQHITGIPGPSISMALAHLILGKDERKYFVGDVMKKMEIFYEAIGLERKDNIYYGMFDLAHIESAECAKLCIEEKLERIAKKGVVLMPANLFFSRSDRRRKNRQNFIRVSLPNLSFENTRKAAEIIRKTLEN